MERAEIGILSADISCDTSERGQTENAVLSNVSCDSFVQSL